MPKKVSHTQFFYNLATNNNLTLNPTPHLTSVHKKTLRWTCEHPISQECQKVKKNFSL